MTLSNLKSDLCAAIHGGNLCGNQPPSNHLSWLSYAVAGLNKSRLTYIKYLNQNCNEYALLMKVVFRAAKDCSCLV